MSRKPIRPNPRPYQPALEALEARVMLNVAPVITNPGLQGYNEGVTASLLVHASDADGDVLTFSASSLPQGLSIDSSTGLISGFVAYSIVNGGFPSPIHTTVSVSD